MDIEEAIKIVKNITTDDLLNYWEGPEEPYEAIQIILNQLDKQNKALHLMAQELTTPIHGVEWVVNYYLEKAEENK